jgi:hypothetical protein
MLYYQENPTYLMLEQDHTGKFPFQDLLPPHVGLDDAGMV